MHNKSEKTKYKVCIMGASTSTRNRGVSALAISLVKIIRQIKPSADISFIIGSRDAAPQCIVSASGEIIIPTVPYRLSFRSPIKQHLLIVLFAAALQKILPIKRIKLRIINAIPILKEMYEADFIGDIQGGDSFSDIYGLMGFLIGTIPMIIVLLLNKRLVLLPQTYGPYKNAVTAALSSVLIKRSEFVFSRDLRCIQEIKESIKINNVKFCPDVAFMLDPIKPGNTNNVQIIENADSEVIGFNINGLMFNGGYTRSNMFNLKVDYKKLCLQIINMFISQNKKIILIPHTYGDVTSVNSDPSACEQLIKEVNSEMVFMLTDEYNQSELKYIIGKCNFFMGSRMHSCIAALSQNVPTIGLAYSKKFLGVFESIGAGEFVVDCRSMSDDLILQKVYSNYEKRVDMSKILSIRNENIKNEILSSFESVLN